MCPVLRMGRGDVNRPVEVAVLVAAVENVVTFGCLVIALAGLRSFWVPAECDLVRLDRPTVTQQRKCVRVLFDKHPVSTQVQGRAICPSGNSALVESAEEQRKQMRKPFF